MDRVIFALGFGVFALVMLGIVFTVLEFRRLERNGGPRNPRFPL